MNGLWRTEGVINFAIFNPLLKGLLLHKIHTKLSKNLLSSLCEELGIYYPLL